MHDCAYQCCGGPAPQAATGGPSLWGSLDVVEKVHETNEVSNELLSLSRCCQLSLAKLGGIAWKEKVATTAVLLRLRRREKSTFNVTIYNHLL